MNNHLTQDLYVCHTIYMSYIIAGLGNPGKEKVMLVAPNTYMNKSGTAISKVVKSVKSAEKLIVIYDDFNLPLGTLKISFNRSSGGHNGLESIIKSLKTEGFIRLRVGIA